MSSTDHRHQFDPIFDNHPMTGAGIEVFYVDRLATFGRRGAGWLWWLRQRGFAPKQSSCWAVSDQLFSVSERACYLTGEQPQD
jgi:hypothetical protein